VSRREPPSDPDAGLARIARLALRLAGIELHARHGELLDRRRARLGIDDADLDALLDAAEGDDAEARERLVGLLTTNVSSFFRHPHHFDLAAEHALWAAHRRGSARLWSAATATGEEAWSLAMALLDVFDDDAPPATILATDIDTAALAIARRGEYDAAAVSAVPERFRERYLRFTPDGRRFSPVDAARDLVELRLVNLVDPEWPIDGPFDVVLCRNVLMYLEEGHRYSVLEHVSSVLAPDGLLMIDPSEHLGRAAHLFAAGSGGVHARATPPRPTRHDGRRSGPGSRRHSS